LSLYLKLGLIDGGVEEASMLSRVASVALAFGMVITAATTAFALDRLYNTPVPEIDGSAGIAALALLASVGLIAYNRIRK
jgi:hypothetical protein